MSLMGVTMPRPDLEESRRRRPGARGRIARLADGREWLLAEPNFLPTAAGLTSPGVDEAIDRFHERVVLGEDIPLIDVLESARTLLLANYDLDDAEAAELLEVDAGPEAEALAAVVLESLFGPDRKAKGYVEWVRASLLANGLGATSIPASAIHDVLTILMATHRTVPPSQFVDACRASLERDNLERLV